LKSDAVDPAMVTPAMGAGVTDKLWSLENTVRIVNEWEASQKAEQQSA